MNQLLLVKKQEKQRAEAAKALNRSDVVQLTSNNHENSGVQQDQMPKPRKNEIQILAETNRKIINDILFAKICKRPTTEESSRVEAKAEIFKKSEKISNDTMSNFKSLQDHVMMPASMVINYEELAKRVNFGKDPQKIFDYTEYQKIKAKEKQKFEKREQDLLAKYQDNLIEINEKKDLQQDIRTLNHERLHKIKELQEQVKL